MDPFEVDLILENIAGFLNPKELLTLNETSSQIHDKLTTFPDIKKKLIEAPLRIYVGCEYDKPIDIKNIFFNAIDDNNLSIFPSDKYSKADEIINIILKDGLIDINTTNNNGNTALQLATMYKNKKLVNKLIENNVDIDYQEEFYGDTALMMTDNPEVAMLLIKAGANLDVRRNNGSTALILAVTNYRREIASMLIEARANPDIQDNFGETALMRIIEIQRSQSWAERERNKEIILKLIKASKNLNLRDEKGRTALMYAERYYPEIVPYLIEAGAIK